MIKLLKTTLFILLFLTHQFANAQQRKLIVALDWFINPNHAPLFVAEQEGFFKQHGLEVKFISPADTSSGEKMVASGKADIVITYQPKLLVLASQGLPLMRFASLIDTNIDCFIVSDDGKIKSIKDLKGKRVGLATASIQDDFTLYTMLQTANLSIKDIEPIYVNFNLISSFLTKRIDGFSGMCNIEQTAIELEGKKTKAFYLADFGIPNYDELIFAANKNKIHDPALINFVKALKLGVTYLKKNPSVSWKKFAINHPEANNQLNKKAWFKTIEYFANDPGKLNKKRYKDFASFMLQKGLIKSIPKLEDYSYEITKEP
jgi:putative hydroxymethylpyrimidine transport system substrate-binding protein